ncbi:acetyltransferase [Nitratireductor aestuarii]|uniref:Acetyltransferase n=1 Tax=Nitratireductor aestuarii TaxID=1735103 RepID=A0A916RN19_9HYPH|nr:GNAT family N-acetyltransferase [Nitratireductor aestuarii]GGA62497.1 acetyltransferase [Nitratireductor aestuarii]
MSGERQPDLADVRRFEAAGFRAWPAATARYDGTWMVRLTAGHPSGRLNSINPMDPGDHHRLDERIERLSRYFRENGRIPSFRLTPLSAPQIAEHLDELGWTSVKPTVVMRLKLDESVLTAAEDLGPTDDAERYVEASVATHANDPAIKPGLRQVLGAIKADRGLFVLDQDGKPVSSALCVRDGDLTGLFDVATAEQARGKGLGRRLVLGALKWAFARGARQAYLQVEEENRTAIQLYRSLGFSDGYRYVYRQPQDQA